MEALLGGLVKKVFPRKILDPICQANKFLLLLIYQGWPWNYSRAPILKTYSAIPSFQKKFLSPGGKVHPKDY